MVCYLLKLDSTRFGIPTIENPLGIVLFCPEMTGVNCGTSDATFECEDWGKERVSRSPLNTANLLLSFRFSLIGGLCLYFIKVWGLELTTASRAAFLVQLTTVIVPVLEALLGRRKLKSQVGTVCVYAKTAGQSCELSSRALVVV